MREFPKLCSMQYKHHSPQWKSWMWCTAASSFVCVHQINSVKLGKQLAFHQPVPVMVTQVEEELRTVKDRLHNGEFWNHIQKERLRMQERHRLRHWTILATVSNRLLVRPHGPQPHSLITLIGASPPAKAFMPTRHIQTSSKYYRYWRTTHNEASVLSRL